jgi:hypothetical protein
MHNTNRYQDFDPYLLAHQRAYDSAEKALRLRSTGNFVEAMAAAETAKHWLRHLALLAP